jgi:hypothetical protein
MAFRLPYRPLFWDVLAVSFEFKQLPLSFILRNAIFFLKLSEELIPFASDNIEVIVRKPAPLFLHLSLKLLPVSFNPIPIHIGSF